MFRNRLSWFVFIAFVVDERGLVAPLLASFAEISQLSQFFDAGYSQIAYALL